MEQWLAAFEQYAIDIEGQKFVEYSNIQNVLTDIGRDIQTEELEMIFAQKLYLDDLISFETFSQNLQQLDDGNTPQLIVGKLKIAKKSSKILQKLVSNQIEKVENEEEEEEDVGGNNNKLQKLNYHANFLFGSESKESCLQIQIKQGVWADNLLKELQQIPINKQQITFLLRLKTVNSQEAKEKLEELVTQGQEMAKQMLGSMAEMIIDAIEIEYFTPDEQSLFVKIGSSNPMIAQMLEAQKCQFEKFMTGNLDFDFHFATSLNFKNLIENKDQTMFEVLFGQQNAGVQLEASLELSKQFLKTMRIFFKKQINKALKKEIAQKFFQNLMHSKLDIDLRFDNIKQLSQLKNLTGPEIFQYIEELTLDKLMNGPFVGSPNTVKEYLNQYYSMALEIPVIEDLVKFVTEQLFGEIDIYAIQGETAEKITIRLPGLGTIISAYLDK